MISTYQAGCTWAHRLPAGAKLVALLLINIAIVPLQDTRALFAILILALILLASCGRRALFSLWAFRPLFFLLAIITAIHHYNNTLDTGIAIVLRISILVILAHLLSCTTRLTDLLAVLEKLLKPLQLIGINSEKVSLAMTLMIRFIPHLMINYSNLQLAWRARANGKAARWHLIVPFIIQAMLDADKVADAISARQFGAG